MSGHGSGSRSGSGLGLGMGLVRSGAGAGQGPVRSWSKSESGHESGSGSRHGPGLGLDPSLGVDLCLGLGVLVLRILHPKEGDPKGLSTVLITALGSREKSVPCDHLPRTGCRTASEGWAGHAPAPS